MTDYEFDQTPDPSPRSRPMAERDLSPHGQRIVSKMERIMLRNARDGRATMDGDFAGIPAADVARYHPLARARVNRQVVRQDNMEAQLGEELGAAGGDPATIRRLMLESTTPLLPPDPAIARHVMDRGFTPRELEEHWGALKSGLAHHIALGRLPEGV